MAVAQPQHAVVGGFEAMIDENIWKDDSIDVPVLMILAKQPVWNDEYESYVRGLVPDLDYLVMPRVGHFIMVEKPDELTVLVRKFVARRPRGS